MKKVYLSVLTFLAPAFALAQTPPTTVNQAACSLTFSSLRELLLIPTCIINRYVIPGLIMGALIAFMWGVIQYIRNADSPAERDKMRGFIGWSILAMFIILSLWAILYVVGNSLQLGQ
jgi:hypothetical protein